MTTEQKAVAAMVRYNYAECKHPFDGMTSHQIGVYNRYLMFGEDDSAFPSQEEWRMIVD